MGRATSGQPHEKQVIGQTWSAKVKVRVIRTTQTANANGYFDDLPQTGEMVPMDMEITAPSLEKLQEKVTAHVNLLEEPE